MFSPYVFPLSREEKRRREDPATFLSMLSHFQEDDSAHG